jgi:hypothetical protein
MATTEAEDEADLGLLARQTLSGVEVNDLPPEPLALGVDLGRLATTSQPPAPPRRADDTDGRIDLRASSPGVVLAPASAPTPSSAAAVNGAAALAARLRAQRASKAPVASRPPPLLAKTIEPRPPLPQLDRELDALIASRSSPVAAVVETSLKSALELVRRAPSWIWVLASGVAIGLVLGLGLGGGDGVEPSTEVTAAPESPAPSAGVPVLPEVVASTRIAAPSPGSPSAARARPSTSGDRSQRHVQDSSNAREPPAAVAATPAPAPSAGASRSIDTLLDQAIGGGPTPQVSAGTTRSASVDPTRPSIPARGDVARLLAEAMSRVRICAGGRSGVAKAQIVVKSSGRISSVKILGAPFSRTTAARCMETAIRGVAFPPFTQSTFRVTYPYAL